MCKRTGIAILLCLSLLLNSSVVIYAGDIIEEELPPDFEEEIVLDDAATTDGATTEKETFSITEFKDLQLKSIGSKCGCEKTDNYIRIYPYINEDKFVEIKQILLSDMQFVNGLKKTVSTDSVYATEKYVYVTLPNGTTIGYLPFSETYAYTFVTTNLPSIYVRAVMNRCRRQST